MGAGLRVHSSYLEKQPIFFAGFIYLHIPAGVCIWHRGSEIEKKEKIQITQF